MKILTATWFTGSGMKLIGVVIGIDEITNERKAYVGTASGLDEGLDAQHIASHGAKLHLVIAESIVRALKPKELPNEHWGELLNWAMKQEWWLDFVRQNGCYWLHADIYFLDVKLIANPRSLPEHIAEYLKREEGKDG